MIKFKVIFLVILSTLLFVCQTQAADRSVTLTTYYPAPQGAFDQIRLLPHARTSPCEPGTLIRDVDTDLPLICINIGGGLTQWSLISDLWNINGDQLYPTNSITNNQIVTGMGTNEPSFRLTLDNDGGIFSRAEPGREKISLAAPVSQNSNTATFFWYPKKASLRIGVLATSETDDMIGSSSVNFGQNNLTQGVATSILGGLDNQAPTDYSTVLGGKENIAQGSYAVIAGGLNNQTFAPYSYVYGLNNATYFGAGAYHVTIAGGECNFANNSGATIGGGAHHQENCNIGADCCTGSYATGLNMTIGGGSYHKASGDYATITGGYGNTASGHYSTITGAEHSWARGDYSTIGGGKYNYSVGNFSTIGGGQHNNDPSLVHSVNLSASHNAVAGGAFHFIDGQKSAISGGDSNIIRGNYSAIIAGEQNKITGHYSTIGGGFQNDVRADYSFVHGIRLTLSEGTSNRAVFWWNNHTDTSAERILNDSNIFLLENTRLSIHEPNPRDTILNIRNENSATPFLALSTSSTATIGNVFLIKGNGHIAINNPNPPNNCVLKIGSGAGGCIDTNGQILTLSSRESKENIRAVDASATIKALKQLEPVRYRYKTAPDEKHFGFIAEDVPELVATPDRQGLNPMEITALLTGIIQNQQKRMQDQQKAIEDLKSRITELESNK